MIFSSMFSNPSALFGSLLFGAIGLAVFVYGKKMVLWKPMVIGVVLMAYPCLSPRLADVHHWLRSLLGAVCLPRLSTN